MSFFTHSSFRLHLQLLATQQRSNTSTSLALRSEISSLKSENERLMFSTAQLARQLQRTEAKVTAEVRELRKCRKERDGAFALIDCFAAQNREPLNLVGLNDREIDEIVPSSRDSKALRDLVVSERNVSRWNEMGEVSRSASRANAGWGGGSAEGTAAVVKVERKPWE